MTIPSSAVHTTSRLVRFFALLLVLSSAAPLPAREAPVGTLTEELVVTRALARAPLVDAQKAEQTIHAGRARSARAYANPEVAYTREQTFGASGTTEDYVSLAQTIDLGNRRGLRGEAAEATGRAARSEAHAERLAVEAEARLRFYELLYRQERASSLERWAQRIEEALQVVAKREASGDAAAYDRRRLEREHAVARARSESERASLERARARVGAIMGVEQLAGEASGSLLPADDPADAATLRTSAQVRPELLALQHRRQAAELERSAAGRWWAPDLRIDGGWKRVALNGGGRSDGFSVGASLALPLWDQGSGAREVAEGELRAAQARRELLGTELGAELAGAREEALLLRRAAREFRERSEAISGDLVRIAAAGYGGGELGLIELLDAYRGAADDALSVLEMELAARRARIELDRMAGGKAR